MEGNEKKNINKKSDRKILMVLYIIGAVLLAVIGLPLLLFGICTLILRAGW